jgi:catechol 2,3-dioxygenase-like lactoylglutathione lyase family enzyme
MDQVLALRPFVPARDMDQSVRFYTALGFRVTQQSPELTMLKIGGFSFMLTTFYVKEAAETYRLQLMVRDLDSWWANLDIATLVARFALPPAKPPAMQPWGLRVAFLTDPSGIVWHIAESMF